MDDSAVLSNSPAHGWWRSPTAFFSLLAVFTSGAVFLAAFLTTRSADRDRLRLEYVRVAVAILEPATPTGPQKELRKWAVEVLNKSAPIKLTSEQSQALVEAAAALPKLGDYGYNDYGYGNGYGTDYGYYFGDPCGPEPSATPSKNP